MKTQWYKILVESNTYNDSCLFEANFASESAYQIKIDLSGYVTENFIKAIKKEYSYNLLKQDGSIDTIYCDDVNIKDRIDKFAKFFFKSSIISIYQLNLDNVLSIKFDSPELNYSSGMIPDIYNKASNGFHKFLSTYTADNAFGDMTQMEKAGSIEFQIYASKNDTTRTGVLESLLANIKAKQIPTHHVSGTYAKLLIALADMCKLRTLYSLTVSLTNKQFELDNTDISYLIESKKYAYRGQETIVGKVLYTQKLSGYAVLLLDGTEKQFHCHFKNESDKFVATFEGHKNRDELIRIHGTRIKQKVIEIYDLDDIELV